MCCAVLCCLFASEWERKLSLNLFISCLLKEQVFCRQILWVTCLNLCWHYHNASVCFVQDQWLSWILQDLRQSLWCDWWIELYMLSHTAVCTDEADDKVDRKQVNVFLVTVIDGHYIYVTWTLDILYDYLRSVIDSPVGIGMGNLLLVIFMTIAVLLR